VVRDATGYEPQHHNTLAKLYDGIVHIGRWDGSIVAVAAATVAVWLLCRLVRALRSLATLIALLAGTVLVAAGGIDVPLVGDIATVPNALPGLEPPDLSAVPHLLVGAAAVALVALAQAAGIGASVPNPDGSRSNMSRDFIAQGVANIGGGLFQALPAGGSLSRTGVAVSAGAGSRWAGIFAGLWLALVVVLFGSAAEHIPSAVIGGLIIVIGGELIAGRVPDIRLVARTAPISAAAMIITFVATTQLALQNAIFLGAAISLLLYCIQAARTSSLVALEPAGDGRWRTATVPAVLAGDRVTVLHYSGVGLFAEVPRLDETWPRLDRRTRRAVIVLSIRSLPDVPSSTAIKAFDRLAARLAEPQSRLLLAGVEPELERILSRSGFIQRIGRENVVAATAVVFASLDEAVRRGEAWLASTASRC
jgi:SulP family sulfate permease